MYLFQNKWNKSIMLNTRDKSTADILGCADKYSALPKNQFLAGR